MLKSRNYTGCLASLSGLLVPLVISVFFLPSLVSSVELTFELPDNAKECFYENIPKGKQTTFEFQVRFYYGALMQFGAVMNGNVYGFYESGNNCAICITAGCDRRTL